MRTQPNATCGRTVGETQVSDTVGRAVRADGRAYERSVGQSVGHVDIAASRVGIQSGEREERKYICECVDKILSPTQPSYVQRVCGHQSPTNRHTPRPSPSQATPGANVLLSSSLHPPHIRAAGLDRVTGRDETGRDSGALLLPLGLLLAIGPAHGLFRAASRIPGSSILASLLARGLWGFPSIAVFERMPHISEYDELITYLLRLLSPFSPQLTTESALYLVFNNSTLAIGEPHQAVNLIDEIVDANDPFAATATGMAIGQSDPGG